VHFRSRALGNFSPPKKTALQGGSLFGGFAVSPNGTPPFSLDFVIPGEAFFFFFFFFFFFPSRSGDSQTPFPAGFKPSLIKGGEGFPFYFESLRGGFALSLPLAPTGGRGTFLSDYFLPKKKGHTLGKRTSPLPRSGPWWLFSASPRL